MMSDLKQIKIKLNDIESFIMVNDYSDIFDMHIKEIAKLANQDLHNRLILRNYVKLEIMLGAKTWTHYWIPPGTFRCVGPDGYNKEIPLNHFAQIISVSVGIPGVEIEPIKPHERSDNLIYNINADSPIVLATPICTAQNFSWEVNCYTSLMLFLEIFERHKTFTSNGLPRTIIYHDKYLGYHFDIANEKTILRYYKKKGLV